jgi:hypothetical protein
VLWLDIDIQRHISDTLDSWIDHHLGGERGVWFEWRAMRRGYVDDSLMVWRQLISHFYNP